MLGEGKQPQRPRQRKSWKQSNTAAHCTVPRGALRARLTFRAANRSPIEVFCPLAKCMVMMQPGPRGQSLVRAGPSSSLMYYLGSLWETKIRCSRSIHEKRSMDAHGIRDSWRSVCCQPPCSLFGVSEPVASAPSAG